MNTGAFGEGFPYSNFHDLNLDWIIKIAKNFLDQYTHIQDVITSGEESISELTTNSLEQLQEKAETLEGLLQAWYDTHSKDIVGELADALQDIQSELSTAISEFRTTSHEIAEDTIESIPADYTALSNNVDDIDYNLEEFNTKAIFGLRDHSKTNPTFWLTGMEFVYNIHTDGYDVNGTNTTEGSHNVYLNESGFPGNLKPNDIFRCEYESNMGINCYVQIFFYINSQWDSSKYVYTKTRYIKIPATATGMLIRIYVAENYTASDGFIRFNILNRESTVNIQEAIPTITPDGTYDQTDSIELALEAYGTVVLSEGTYIINNLTMPENSSIRGAGSGTILQTTDNTAHGIIPGTRCTIENVQILGTRSTASNIRAGDAGIYIEWNYDNTPLSRNIKISNCFIYGFGLAGIYSTKTGYWVANSISATDCEICVCYAGILLEDHAEYNRFTNILCYSNYVGLMNRSGNNVFVNCSFSNNTVGVYLDCDDTDHEMSENNGHGAVIGATINHSDNNNGYGILVKGVDHNGFIFDSCNIWYSKVQVENSTGIVISNSIFGADAVIESYYNDGFFLKNNIFKTTPTFTGSPIIKDGNTLFDGTAVN